MPELWASQWKEGGVAGIRKEHAMAAQSVIPRETKGYQRDEDCTTNPMNHDSGNTEQTNMTSLWDCEPVAIAHLWLLFTQFICEWTPWEILPGLYVYAKLLPYKIKTKFKFCIPTYSLFVTILAKKTYLLLCGPLWEIFWLCPYSDHDLYSIYLVLLRSGLACT